jgi:DNA polymerase/3'-5' exonuclease PolX
MVDVFNLILNNFDVKAQSYSKEKNIFKAKAYNKAIDTLNTLGTKSLITEDDIKQLKFGKSLHEKALYMLNTNVNLADVNDICIQKIKKIREISKIQSIGMVKASQLVEENNIQNIEDLLQNQHLLNKKQIIGLKYHQDITRRIPRTEIVQHEDYIHSVLCNTLIPSIFNYEIVGSYRRKKNESGDIDIIIGIDHPNGSEMKIITDEFLKKQYLPKDGIFAIGKTKFMGMCKLSNCKYFRRLDILITSKDEYPFSLLYFTGNCEFNVKMREYAKKKGFTLNEKGLKHTKENKIVEHVFNNETDIFNFLKIKYLNPEDRQSCHFTIQNN